MDPAHPAEPRQALLTARIIALAIGLGPTVFAVVAWAVRPAPSGDPSYQVLLYTFLGVAFSAALAALLVWRGRVGPAIDRARRQRAAGSGSAHPAASAPADAARIQTGAIIVWAVAEGAALLGVVVYFLSGRPLTAVVGLFLVWITIGLTWPRGDWYGVEPRRPG